MGIDTVRADLDGRPIDVEVEKFKTFVDYVDGNDRMLLSTRHDGSLDVITRLLGKEYADKFLLAPDGGFFSTYEDYYHPELEPGKINIAINYGGDLLDARFPGAAETGPDASTIAGVIKPKDYEAGQMFHHQGFNHFNLTFANVLKQLYQDNKEINLIYVPHIYRDIEVGYQLINELGFPLNRRAVTSAPYVSGFKGKDYIVDLYRKCDLTLGMRFHANICPIGLGTPSIGLETFPILGPLYGSLGLADQNIVAHKTENLDERLFGKIKESLANASGIRQRYSDVKQALQGDLKQVFTELEVRLDQ